uniref:Uncharacterized protein n=1 Tax=Equus asinus TaxID=9793 RepID=A0A8C4MSW3_EQUAS
MRKFAYHKVDPASSLIWVLLHRFLLLDFSEHNTWDGKKERELPARDGVKQTCTQLIFL